MIGGTLSVGVADDEGDAGVAESGERVVRPTGTPSMMLAASRGIRVWDGAA
jgi:hypothetical protein